MADKKKTCGHCNEQEDACSCDEYADYYDENIQVIDQIMEGIIRQLKEVTKNNDYTSEQIHELAKNLKNLASAKKNILKADLLNIELDDCLYDDLEDDLANEEDPIDFEEEEIEEVEPEEKKELKSNSKKKSKK